ncbi:DoxX-like family protein [Cytobacillus purgationiresistens]|uniref:DoxX-like family protein n=1 Tax=Cytobacillus purgationiresistens TaxID=863449 RepID=A0ABU0AER3_9BACI|nr:DoxX-like family protein [Cytobacillus purgationiresistens]MDQ0269746.1 hypothetical protein [Cytobacillus purgationiresistens]
MTPKPIYVETEIHTSIEKLWEATQTPSLHEQRDIRFSSITYLPKKEGEEQHFSYKRSLGPLIEIEGWGVSAGSYDSKNGTRSSSLHFGANTSLSPIKEGKGYWKYSPRQENVNFITQYNYEVPFGKIGGFFDAILIRPMIGWGTALSFDVLKNWLEKGESPAAQYMRFFSSWMISLFFCFIWFYHGLIPKLVLMHPDEITMITNLVPLSEMTGYRLVQLAGILEICFAVTWLVLRNKRKLFMLQIFIFPLLTIGAIAANPASLMAPFNPLTFNISLWVLSIAGFILSKELPSSRNCIRKG